MTWEERLNEQFSLTVGGSVQSNSIENTMLALKFFIAEVEERTAWQCYLETLAVGCGETEYSEAIRSKFNLKGKHE